MIPQMDPSWPTQATGDACELIMGQAPSGDTYNAKGEGMPLIAGAADLGNMHPSPKKWTTAPTKVGEAGDIILCVRATIGDLNWADDQYCYGRGVAGLRARRERALPEFAFYWLQACKDHLLGLGRGATFKQISKTDIAALPFPSPDLAEQRRIVARIKECMERVDEIETLRGECIDEADALLPSMLNESFVSLSERADMAAIGDVALETRYGTSSKCNSNGNGMPILRIPNVAGGFVNFGDLKHCPLDARERARIELAAGDLLFVRTNGSRDLVGRCAIYEGNGEEKHGFASYLIRVRPDQYRVLPHYLAFFLNSTLGRAEIDKRRRTSAGQFNINSENLRSIRLPLPSLSEQEAVVAALQDRQKRVIMLQAEVSANSRDGHHLRESILRKAFAGEL